MYKTYVWEEEIKDGLRLKHIWTKNKKKYIGTMVFRIDKQNRPDWIPVGIALYNRKDDILSKEKGRVIAFDRMKKAEESGYRGAATRYSVRSKGMQTKGFVHLDKLSYGWVPFEELMKYFSHINEIMFGQNNG